MSNDLVTLPNLVTFGRALAAIPIAMAILAGRFQIALAIVVVAGFSDLIDGALARKTGTATDIGRLLDPIADKLLLVTVFVAVSIPGLGFEPLPWWLAAMAIGRDLAMVAAAGLIYYFTGFSGFTPTLLGKLNTFLELVVLGVFLGTRAFGLPEAPLTALVYLTAASITASGIHYVFHVRRLLARREAPGVGRGPELASDV